MSTTTVPPSTIPANISQRLDELGAPPGFAAPLYRCMAIRPGLLTGWVELTWNLMLHATTPRRICELVIVRTTMLIGADFERGNHERFARDAGVTQEELDALPNWQASTLFSPAERAALALSDAMNDAAVPDDVLAALTEQFSPESVVELIVMCGYYAMVPRVNDAMRVR